MKIHNVASGVRGYLFIGLFTAFSGYADDPVDFAVRQIGKPYEMTPAAIGPDVYDCSGLTKAAYEQANIALPHHAASQALLGQPVTAPFQRGDLLFFDSSDQPGVVTHVGIVESGVTMINAHGFYRMVRRDDYTENYWATHFLFARRLLERDIAPAARWEVATAGPVYFTAAPQRQAIRIESSSTPPRTTLTTSSFRSSGFRTTFRALTHRGVRKQKLSRYTAAKADRRKPSGRHSRRA